MMRSPSPTAMLLALTIVSGVACAADTPAPAPHEPPVISMRAAEALLGKPNVYFLDANTPEIWQQGHIPGAIYINQANWPALLPADRRATLIFYCANRLCMASYDAAGMAISLGYRQVFHMTDGIFGWITSGRAIEKADTA
ncbi:rhodanese-like domain-containing protein [Edwardsiella piscicida]|uniref:rhodanese-like domain-containing protein n=1 Tax=Edwardsiella piscicida TaxID=1263550 RepID=UPI00370D68EB